MATQIITKSSPIGIGKFSKLLKYSLFSIIFTIMIVNAILISLESNSIEPGIQYLGDKFLTVTKSLGENSEKVIQQGGIWLAEDTMFKKIWEFIEYFFNIFTDLFIIYIWLTVLAWFIKKFVLLDESRPTIAYGIAFVLFILLQIIFILAFTSESMMTPINSFISFFKSVPYIVKPATEIADRIYDL